MKDYGHLRREMFDFSICCGFHASSDLRQSAVPAVLPLCGQTVLFSVVSVFLVFIRADWRLFAAESLLVAPLRLLAAAELLSEDGCVEFPFSEIFAFKSVFGCGFPRCAFASLR